MGKKYKEKIQFILVVLWAVIVVFSNIQANVAALPLLGKLKGVEYFNENGEEGVFVYCDNPGGYSDFTLANPNRIVVDFEYMAYNGKTKEIDVAGDKVKTVRYAQFKKDIVRVVLELYNKQEYKIEKGNGYIKVYINKGQDINGNSRDGDIRNTGDNSRGDIERDSISLPGGINIFYPVRENKSEISITFENKNFDISTLANPDRIVIDLPDAKFSKQQEEIRIDSGFLKSVRFSQYQNGIGRLVFDLAAKPLYKTDDTGKKLTITTEESTNTIIEYGDIIYDRKDERTLFIIKGAKLGGDNEDPKPCYTGRYDSTGKVYTVTFPSKCISLPNGIMEIDDDLFESVVIAKNLITKKTRMILRGKEKLNYEIVTRYDSNDTAINVLRTVPKSVPAKEKLVVIDAGHGGTEPGAIYGNVIEKDLNLDIALKLNELLQEKGVKTYMIREDDSYVGIYERAFIANSLNASLFLSIHNNALTDQGFDGTMTLYNVRDFEKNSFNSYKFAKNIQDSLIKTLKTKDRNLRERTDLVVLKYTKMPAALAEVAFLTNKGDRDKLTTSEFRQKAAQALCDAVVKSLSELE